MEVTLPPLRGQVTISGRSGHGNTSFWQVGNPRPGTILRVEARPASGWAVFVRERGGGISVRGIDLAAAHRLLPDYGEEVDAAQALLQAHVDLQVRRWRARQQRYRREILAAR